MSSERRYLDPWDIENYLYLRTGPIRRRSVCFDHVLQYGSYHKDGYGPIYGSLIETPKLKSDGDVNDKDNDDKSSYIYNSLPSTPTQCPSCLRDYQEGDECRKTPDTIYEDITMKTAMERRRKRIRLNKLQQAQQTDPKFGMNTLGHLRIDYSGNWNKLDRYIGHT